MRLAYLFVLLAVAATLDLPYQAHSFNDLDYFIQLVKKGVKTFKMDLSLVSKDSCLKHSSWNESRSSCTNIDPYTSEICCLGFRGDASSTPDYNYDFNTSDEFVEMLTRKDVLPYFKKSNIFIAINFQYSDSQNNLTKMFLYDLMKTINTSALNITICSGTDNIILDYDFKCITQGRCKDDPYAQYISESGIVLQTSSREPYDPHDVKKRFRNFNAYYKEVGKFCSEGFPSWVDKYPYPIIFWEPSNEQQIQYVAKAFLSDACLRPPKHNTINDLAIASNLEPEMFQTYFQNYEQDLGLGKKYLFQNASAPLLSSLKVDNKQWVLLAYRSDVDGTSHLQLRDNLENVANQLTFSANITALSGHLDTFLVNLQNTSGLFTQLYSSNFQLQSQWSISQKYLISLYSNGLARYLSKVSDTYYNYITTADGKSAQTSGCELGFTPTSMVMNDLVYIVGQKAGQIWLSYNCTATTLIGYGTEARIASRNDGLEVLIGDGMCQSAVLSNNNQMNKCDFYKYEEFREITSVPKMISYVGGPISAFNQIKNNNSEPITGCNSRFSAAKIANGAKPTHIVLNNDKVLMAYEYVPLNKQPLMTTLFCGASNYDKVQTGNHFILSWFALRTYSSSNLHQEVIE